MTRSFIDWSVFVFLRRTELFHVFCRNSRSRHFPEREPRPGNFSGPLGKGANRCQKNQ